MTLPNETANVVIEDPRVRKLVGTILSYATLILALTTALDTAVPTIDLAWITGPAALFIASVLGNFQLTVTNPNVPK